MINKSDLKARAARYRELAAEVLRLKEQTRSQETHTACVKLAAGWKSLADNIETGLQRDGGAAGKPADAGESEGDDSEEKEKRSA